MMRGGHAWVRTGAALAVAAVLLLIGAALSLLAPARAEASAAVCEREIETAARRHGVPVGVLYAVGLTETGRGGRLHPNAMNIEGEPYFAADARAAVRRFDRARRSGKRLIDLGCMQINHHWHHHAFRSVDHMLEPRANVDYAARFLRELRAREGSWTMAVARYHAGPNNDPAQKRYVCKVIGKLVATGFGAWTPAARSFCG
jgi:soluble lytic murein transglycosylase-like protein